MPEYTENTFKNSNWTMFYETGCHGPLSPYKYILIQAPRGVAEDLIRKWIGVEPNDISCQEHQSSYYSISENCEIDSLAKWLFTSQNTGTFLVIRHDSIPYYEKDIWPMAKWKEVKM